MPFGKINAPAMSKCLATELLKGVGIGEMYINEVMLHLHAITENYLHTNTVCIRIKWPA